MILHSTPFTKHSTVPCLWYISTSVITILTRSGVFIGDYYNYTTFNNEFTVKVKIL